MFGMHPDLYRSICNTRREELHREAEIWRLLRQAKRDRQSWFSQHGCWLLCRLGYLLVRWGRRLEAYGGPQVALETSGQVR